MDKSIDSRFERLERALTTLVDSVNKYNPTIAHAEELEAADTHLSNGLEDVQKHQNNYLRILSLRASSAALDTQIRTTLSTLASTRKDIVTTQTTTFPPGPNYPFAYGDLLSYARRISKTTMPPAAALQELIAATPVEGQTPGAHTPAESIPASAAPTPTVQSPAIPNGTGIPAQPSVTTLPGEITAWINPHHNTPFHPWPLEHKIRSGALASNQALAESGIDLKGYDPALEEERKRLAEEKRKEEEEKERLVVEEKERKAKEDWERMRAQREREQEEWRRASLAGGPSPDRPAAGEKKQFQFASLDEDLSDDED